MTKDIYKITNKINGKIYIGQSKNCKKRFKEHSYNYKTSNVSKIRNAINKYGIENFSFEIIEHDIENYNEREKYWIKYYHSNEKEFGYNITEGGEVTPIIAGEDSLFCTHSNEIVNKIQNDILYTNNSFKYIADKYNIRIEYVYALNQGTCRKNNAYKYPLRKQGNEKKDINIILDIIKLLDNTGMSIQSIAKQTGVSRITVHRINNGEIKSCPTGIQYPIRINNETISQKTKNNLIKELKQDKKKFIEIAEEYFVSRVFISRFNNGKIYKQTNLQYPIRKSSERVY